MVVYLFYNNGLHRHRPRGIDRMIYKYQYGHVI